MRSIFILMMCMAVSVPVSAREKTECNQKTKQCVTIPYSAQEDLRADAAAAEAAKASSEQLSTADRLIKFLANRFGMSEADLRKEIQSQK